MATVITPNMNLSVPVVGQEPGPDWATDLNNCMSTIDTHDHSPGKGILITPSGLNISADLPFNNNNLISVRTVRFTPNPSIGVTDLNASYVNGVDLYFVDGNGNQVRITQSGAVAGTPGSIANLVTPASASYVGASGTFVWQQAANTSADMDFGSAILRNDTANSKGLTLQPPSAMAADYSITLPALPGSTSLMTMTASGVLGTTTQITNTQLPALNSAVSSSCGTFTISSNTPLMVTNLTVTITTAGRPVWVGLIDDASGGASVITASTTTSSTAVATVQAFPQILKASTAIFNSVVGGQYYAVSSSALAIEMPVSSVFTIDYNAVAGSNTYSVWLKSNGVSDTAAIINARLFAYELP